MSTKSAKASGITSSIDGRSEPASMRAASVIVLRRADAGDHVLALRIDQELAVERLLAGRRVAGEGDAGRRGLAHVAEHHGLHVDGGAPALGNVVQAAIGDGARVHPAREHRADRAPELLLRVLRERPCRAPPRPWPCRARSPSASRRPTARCRARSRAAPSASSRISSKTSWSTPSTTSEYIWMKRR